VHGTSLIKLSARHGECIGADECAAFAAPLYRQLSEGRYDYPASVLQLDDFDAWCADHRTARKRAARAERLGYSWAEIDRADFADDVHAINTSMPVRQGQPMSAGYRERQEFGPADLYACPRHAITTFGVFAPDEHLVAYTVIYTSGDLAMVSQILGHGEHLANDIMYLLMRDVFAWIVKPITVFYNRHDSGTDGLRYFKERLGFQPERVAWSA